MSARQNPSSQVVVDGSNLATEGRSLPSLAQLDEAVRAYRDEHADQEIIVVVDASFGYRIDESERKIFEEAEDAGEIVSPPAGAIGRGDGFLLRIADRTGAIVLSNDSFQEFHGEYGWLFDEGRLVGGKPVPGVGWIFTPRTPVRGPRSRVATRDADRSRKRAAVKTVPVEPVAEAIAEATAEAIAPDTPKSPRRGRRRSRGGGEGPPEAINEPLPFITFIAEHRLGSEVEGTVEGFTSHGAFVMADGARCYAPVVGLGDPPPRSAKEVLTRGEVRTFVVQALDPPRRGIELALPGLARVAGAPTEETVEAEIDVGSQGLPAEDEARPRRSRRTKVEPVAPPEPEPVAVPEPAGAATEAKPRRSRRAKVEPVALPEPEPAAEEAKPRRTRRAKVEPVALPEPVAFPEPVASQPEPVAEAKPRRSRRGQEEPVAARRDPDAHPQATRRARKAATAVAVDVVPAAEEPPRKATRTRKAAAKAPAADEVAPEAPAKKPRAKKVAAAEPVEAPVTKSRAKKAATQKAPGPVKKAAPVKKASKKAAAATS